MIPLQIYDSTKTTIIPLVELWWNYRGGITKIVSESAMYISLQALPPLPVPSRIWGR
jgi:hypothetical protein